MLSMRLDHKLQPKDHLDSQIGVLWIDDGCHKALAAFINLLGLLAIASSFSDESLQNSNVKALLESLLRIPSVLKVVPEDDTSAVSGQIGRIIKQNADAQVQPVSSFDWALMLQGLQKSDASLTYTAALALYNEHPLVKAYETSDTWVIPQI